MTFAPLVLGSMHVRTPVSHICIHGTYARALAFLPQGKRRRDERGSSPPAFRSLRWQPVPIHDPEVALRQPASTSHVGPGNATVIALAVTMMLAPHADAYAAFPNYPPPVWILATRPLPLMRAELGPDPQSPSRGSGYLACAVTLGDVRGSGERVWGRRMGAEDTSVDVSRRDGRPDEERDSRRGASRIIRALPVRHRQLEEGVSRPMRDPAAGELTPRFACSLAPPLRSAVFGRYFLTLRELTHGRIHVRSVAQRVMTRPFNGGTLPVRE
ncbi:hypothetical protein K438DRAFT_1986807 [Mycena galopus ATCC 62051]|nr:hypothetical protein K438DRAFT_1986807 [Mycena galopus ATCC 62051]